MVEEYPEMHSEIQVLKRKVKYLTIALFIIGVVFNISLFLCYKESRLAKVRVIQVLEQNEEFLSTLEEVIQTAQ